MRPILSSLLTCFLMLAATLHAEDWPQWMGPQRDNVWRESGIVERFPEGGPPVLWRAPVAGGYAGAAVADGRVYLTDYVTSENVKVDNFDRKQFTGTERVLCLDAKSGRTLWKHEYPVTYGFSYPAGPRCTPNVNDGKVYTLGAEGHLLCFDAETGAVVWSRHLTADYSTQTALWGYASHPLIDGDKLICLVGGQGSLVVAFDKHTGQEIWRSLTGSQQGYAPQIIIEAGGVRQLIVFYPDAVASLDPQTGELYWSVDYQATNGAAIMTPVHSGKWLYAGSFSNKNLLLELDRQKPGAEVVWQDEVKAAIAPVNVQPFLQDGYLYGCDQGGDFLCVELATGTRVWQSTEPLGVTRAQNSGTAFIVKQGDRFWLFNEQGELIIARLTPEGYQEVDRAKVIEPTNVAFGRRVVWCAPAFAGGKVFIRNDEECICVDLSEN